MDYQNHLEMVYSQHYKTHHMDDIYHKLEPHNKRIIHKLNQGDEILRTNLEYPNMIQALDMREKRFGTKIQIVDIPIHPESQEQIVNLIIDAINPKTKVLLVSHMVSVCSG